LEDFNTLNKGKNPRPKEWVAKVAQHPKLADIPNELGLKPIPRYACKMATGSGKTVVMAMLISWASAIAGPNPATRVSRAAPWWFAQTLRSKRG
jgi:type III restriction enzyme